MVGDTSTHPPLPPTQEDERLDWLRLLRSRRVGVATFARLLREHGTARAALRALPGIARNAGVQDYAPCPEGVALAEYRAGLSLAARLILKGEPDYPSLLALLPDAPPLLWALGDTALLSRPTVALVGARNASSLGLRMARSLAEGLGQAGLVVVSGLARGIDAAAHAAALPTGTVAVMAGGVDHIYPTENTTLAADIAARGLRVSEHPIGLEPQARHFPARNRIVSGLCLGVVVVEAAERSGTLITARTAADQGREVLAVPGHPVDPRAAGCNLLLRDGATLVRGADDVLEALGPSLERWRAATFLAQDVTGEPLAAGAAEDLPARRPASSSKEATAPHALKSRRCVSSADPRETAPGEPIDQATPPAKAAVGPDLPSAPISTATDLRTRILGRLGPSPLAEDQLIRDLGERAALVAPTLTDLELEGLVIRQPGGLLALAA